MFVLPYGAAAASIGGEIHHIALASDGSILAAGCAFNLAVATSAHTCTLLIKLSTTGALQPGFAGGGATCFDFGPKTNGGTVNGHFEDISIEADDGFLVTSPYTNLDHYAAARLLSNGTLDSNFGAGGVISVPFPSWLLARQANGDTLIAGGATSIAATRIHPGGATDLTYGNGGVLTFDSRAPFHTNPISARLDLQERLLVSDIDVGTGGQYQIGRVDTTGNLDATFNGSLQQPGTPGFASLQIAPDSSNDGIVASFPIAGGSVFAVGYRNNSFNSGDPYHIVVARLGVDASFDTAFGDAAHPGWAAITLGSGVGGNTARSAAADSSGHIFISTNVVDDHNRSCAAIIRLTPDRVFDAAFEEPAALACPGQ